MQTISVYNDASKHSLGGPWYPNSTNFPACKLLLHWDDVADGDSTWTDRISGIVVPATTTFSKDSVGVRGATDVITAGSLPTVGDLYPALVWQGVFASTVATSTCILGDENFNCIQVGKPNSGNYYLSATQDAANYIGVANAAGASYPLTGCVTMFGETDSTTANGQASLIASDSTGAYHNVINKSGVDGGVGIDTTWEAFTSNYVGICTSGTSGVKILALFCFTVEPSAAEIALANRWMASNPGKLYPGWAGKS